MKYIEYLASHEWCSETVKLFLSKGIEQKKIIAWCKKYPSEDLANLYKRYELVMENSPDDLSPYEGWEASLILIAYGFDGFHELYEWEIASAEARMAHTTKVARLARELANALTEKPHAWYPPVLGLFDENHAQDIYNLLPERDRKFLTLQDKDVRRVLRWHFPKGQSFPSLLRGLADHAEEKVNDKKRIARPNTGHPNSRAFALHLADYFNEKFKRIPNEVIAACVCLKYPELENPPNADTIRDWRGVK